MKRKRCTYLPPCDLHKSTKVTAMLDELSKMSISEVRSYSSIKELRAECIRRVRAANYDL